MNVRFSRRLGIALQGIVMGTLLWLALAGIVVAHFGARVFRYEGF